MADRLSLKLQRERLRTIQSVRFAMQRAAHHSLLRSQRSAHDADALAANARTASQRAAETWQDMLGARHPDPRFVQAMAVEVISKDIEQQCAATEAQAAHDQLKRDQELWALARAAETGAVRATQNATRRLSHAREEHGAALNEDLVLQRRRWTQ